MASQMLSEISEIPEATRRLLNRSSGVIVEAANKLRNRNPSVLLTIARGSSDHAATYLKYAFEIGLGVPVASVAPSVGSVYRADMRLGDAATIAISQSGQSPDIVEMSASAARSGALSIAITNDQTSPLAGSAEITIPLHAGSERSVAATKTYVTAVVAELLLLAHWAENQALLAALEALPEQFERALACDWSSICKALTDQETIFTLGRGLCYAISLEAALKLKEVAQIYAQSHSSAEVLHGPISIVEIGMPILAFVSQDAAAASTTRVCATLADAGANVFATAERLEDVGFLPVVRTEHSFTAPLTQIASFYVMVEALARLRGLDPDAPRHLKKVTRTV